MRGPWRAAGQNHESARRRSSRRQHAAVERRRQLARVQADADGNLPLWESEQSRLSIFLIMEEPTPPLVGLSFVMARSVLLIAVVLSLLLVAQCSKPKRKAVALDDEEVVQAKDFALKEIIKLSDSYRDMKIVKLISAEKARSAFSDGTNFFLKMELSCVSKCEAPLSPASTCRRGKYKGTNEIIVFWKDDGHYDGIAIDEFPQMDGEFHPCTPSYKGSEKCNPAEHRTPEQAALFMDDPEDDR